MRIKILIDYISGQKTSLRVVVGFGMGVKTTPGQRCSVNGKAWPRCQHNAEIQ